LTETTLNTTGLNTTDGLAPSGALLGAVPIVPVDAPAGAPARSLNDQLSVLLFAMGMVVLVLVSVRMLRRASANRAQKLGMGSTENPRVRVERLRAEAGERQTIDTVMADATELTQRLAAQLENKAVRLETLIAEADDRLVRLERAHAQRPTPASAAPARTNAPSMASRETSDGSGEREHQAGHARVFELADQGLSPVEIARAVNQPTGQVELILALRRRA